MLEILNQHLMKIEVFWDIITC